jgi:serine/threonine-protein kinase HipA
VRHIRDGASFEKLGTLRPGFVEPALGMQRLGDEFELEAVRSFALADFCVRMGIERRYFARELTQLCEFALQEAQAADPAYMAREVAFVQGLAQLVATRAEALLAMARDVPNFTANNF